MRSRWEGRACIGRRFIAGFALLSIGTIVLLMNLGIVESNLLRTWWPLALIALGAAKLFIRRGWYRLRKPYTDFGPA
jgi:Domain of unknown function (DUF5668)